MHKEACTKHEAIEYCKRMLGGEVKAKPTTELSRAAVLHKVFTYYANAVSMTRSAQSYLSARGLDYKLLAARGLSVGYNSGQMHHGTRRDEYLIKSCLEIGLMSESVSGRKSRAGGQQYQVFGHSWAREASATEVAPEDEQQAPTARVRCKRQRQGGRASGLISLGVRRCR